MFKTSPLGTKLYSETEKPALAGWRKSDGGRVDNWVKGSKIEQGEQGEEGLKGLTPAQFLHAFPRRAAIYNQLVRRDPRDANKVVLSNRQALEEVGFFVYNVDLKKAQANGMTFVQAKEILARRWA